MIWILTFSVAALGVSTIALIAYAVSLNREIKCYKAELKSEYLSRTKAEFDKMGIAGIILEHRELEIKHSTLVRVNWVHALVEQIKLKAVTEFAERLKEKAEANEWNGTICGMDIDNLVKEMTEGV